MGMFCYQCQETAKGTGCTVAGVCGKSAEIAAIQDMLIYTVRGVSDIVVKGKLDVSKLATVNEMMYYSLFMTITNANFDGEALKKQIYANIKVRDELCGQLSEEVVASLHDASTFTINSNDELLAKAEKIGVLSTENEDVRSLRELITYGMKGYAAYGHHALNLGKDDIAQYEFMYEAMAGTIDNSLDVAQLTALTLKTGEFGVKVMALLDEANTSTYGNPEMTKVNIGTRNKPAILISGHDLKDLEMLLDQTQGTGVDVYTHSEMLPGNSYPKFKKYENLVGNYGNAWWEQRKEFKTFNGPILFTTNCIVPPTDVEIKDRIFTSGASGFPGTMHIEADENGHKDFTDIIEMAKTLPAPTQIESGNIIAGFAHHQVFEVADKVVEAVKSGAIKHFVVMAGCDGRMKSRSYYTDFANALPKDTVILTAGCAKYRFNKLELGDINGIPRVLDAGQCNDSYSLVLIALKLQEAFGLSSVNELPLAFNISWYEQKAVIVLLALLSLNVKNIHLGPTLPAFISPNVLDVLVNNFGIAGISTVEDDMKIFGIEA